MRLVEFVNKLNSIVDPSRSEHERRFKAKHDIVVTGYPDKWIDVQNAGDNVVQARRLADVKQGEDEELYENIIVDGRKYKNVKSFKNKAASDEFSKANPDWIVISTSKWGDVHMVNKRNKGAAATIEPYNESFKAGNIAMGDKSVYKLSESDAKSLNNVFLMSGMTEARKAKVLEGLTQDADTLKSAITFAKNV